MTTKRNKEKGLHSADPVMPFPPNQQNDSSLTKDSESLRANSDELWTKDDLHSILSGSNKKKDVSKTGTSARSKVEILRANSPTLKRLLAVRIKLDKYVSSKANIPSTSQQPIPPANEIPSTLNNEKSSPTSERSLKKKTKSQPATVNTGPQDKITYEKTKSRNGSIKQKCSLEIWLPQACSDDDCLTTRTVSPDPNTIENKSHSPQVIYTKVRRSSIINPTSNNESKSADETSSKKSEPTVIPRVYHYEDYLGNSHEERPRSSRSNHTNKTDNHSTNKYTKHQQHKRSNNRRITSTTEETAPPVSPGAPMSSKNLLVNIKQTYSAHETKGTLGSNNSQMINELMRKYSMIKKSHQELTQPKLQLERLSYDSKHKEHSLPSAPGSDSASHVSSDPPIVSGKRFLQDSSPPRSAGDYTNPKLLDRRSSNQKSTYPEIFPQARLFSIVNPLQHRLPSASIPPPILPAVITKKSDDSLYSLQRSKTLDVIFDAPLPNPNKISSNSSHPTDSSENALNRSNSINKYDQPPRSPKRSLPPPLLTIRSEKHKQQQLTQPLAQLVQYQNVQNSAQRYHHSDHSSANSLSTSKVLVHLKYSNGGNTDRNCLVPD